jgi:hypothetical protein
MDLGSSARRILLLRAKLFLLQDNAACPSLTGVQTPGFLTFDAIPPALQTSPRPIISRAMPTINLPDDELAAVTAAIRRAIEDDRFPHAPRLDPLRAALARLDAAAEPGSSLKELPPAKADKRARR